MSEPLLLGVRHHGPGSARAVRRALAAFQPDVILIEGPPEADPLVPFAGDEDMRAPVALLAYPADNPDPKLRASFWPFAEFSPEWQAIRWAVACEIPVRFIDLPAAVRLASGTPSAPTPADDTVRIDPIGALAEAAGYDDPERWWEDVVEHRREPHLIPPPPAQAPSEVRPDSAQPQGAGHDGAQPDGAGDAGAQPGAAGDAGAQPGAAGDAGARTDGAGYDNALGGVGSLFATERDIDEERLAAAVAPFAAIAEAMTVVRAHAPAPPEAERIDEERREAHMRQAMRAAMKEFDRVAVVCGAWHVPALTAPLPSASSDAAVLKGLPKVKVAMTWVPWTHARLASWQGYGAGVRSPGWYHHLFTAVDEHVVARWLVRAAGVLRKDGVPVSSAHIIEATRLAEALATMRGRPLAGLAEVTDAAHAVLCDGDDLRLSLINRRLVVGDRLGRVPDQTPGVPIARDVASSQRRLRLQPAVSSREIDLDLRRDLDLQRSQLLHRLRLLGVEWGQVIANRKGRGTFWESWQIAWQPEFAVDLVEAGAYGTTVREAATARVAEQAAEAETLADVTALVERCLLADLPDALPGVLDALDERMALDADVAHLMDALPALARTLRYGDVRGTDLSALRSVTHGMITRVCVGLPAAVGGLDDAAAAVMRDRIDGVQGALALIDDADASQRWQALLGGLSTRDDLHGLLSGRMSRLLLDAGTVDADEIGVRMALVLTVGVPVAKAAAWIEGFLAGDGLLLVHDERLLALVDAWLTGIPADAFVEVLPLLRRTFSGYPAPQRRMIGERAAHIGTGGRPRAGEHDDQVDPDRGALLLPVVARLLGKDLLGKDLVGEDLVGGDLLGKDLLGKEVHHA
ncbi:hypothetical protein Daura_51185 [Dactylosporangium aurantiacum]|uniref:Uncharacterized protein n=1 Tax=Dactylosporangium aurantiacum TaxID=35754 RepID=A0A9Q9MMF0_9ACTN|nr:DUF5682 family protein [Dactylosporangium aurantiacum]MDG6101304.1 DUF5682 family protein [Dactylosporangium aurantiacum]UWZ54687.1 hypothetical protein Daura_51185 [Dactylosporangium aurantiacum]